MSYFEFLNKYGIPVPLEDYTLIRNTIPSGVLLLRNIVSLLSLDPVVSDVGKTVVKTIVTVMIPNVISNLSKLWSGP